MHPITSRQIGYIKAGQRWKGLDDDTYRKWLWSRCKVKSCKELTSIQASILIRELEEAGFSLKKKAAPKPKPPVRTGTRTKANVTGMVSKNQIKLVEVLADMIHWHYEDGFQRWQMKFLKTGKIRTDKQGFRVIEALKSMLDQQMEKDYGPEWKIMTYADERLNRYIRRYHADTADTADAVSEVQKAAGRVRRKRFHHGNQMPEMQDSEPSGI